MRAPLAHPQPSNNRAFARAAPPAPHPNPPPAPTHLRHIEPHVRLFQPLLGLRVEQAVQLATIAELHDKVEVRLGLRQRQ